MSQSIEFLRVKVAAPSPLTHFVFEVNVEDRLMGMQRVFQSRPLNFDKSGRGLPVNEAFELRCEHPEQAFSFEFRYVNAMKAQKTKSVHLFVADLIAQRGSILVELEPSVRATLWYRLQGNFPAVAPRLAARPTVELPKIETDLREFYELSTKIMHFIVFLSRFAGETTKFLLEHNQKRDALFCASATLLVVAPNVFLLSCIFVFFFTSAKFELRSLVVRRARQLWRSPYQPSEVKDTLALMISGQVVCLKVIRFFENSLFSANKFFLMNLFGRVGAVVLLSMLVLVNIPLQLTLVATILGLYLVKYYPVLAVAGQAWEQLNAFLKDNRNASVASFLPTPLEKTCFFYEYQSVFSKFSEQMIEEVFSSDEEGDGEIKRSDFVLPPNWVWVGNWTVDLTAFSDDFGWTTQKVIDVDGTPLKEITLSAKKRKWVRRCRMIADRAEPPQSNGHSLKQGI